MVETNESDQNSKKKKAKNCNLRSFHFLRRKREKPRVCLSQGTRDFRSDGVTKHGEEREEKNNGHSSERPDRCILTCLGSTSSPQTSEDNETGDVVGNWRHHKHPKYTNR